MKKMDDDDAEGENSEVKFESEALDLDALRGIIDVGNMRTNLNDSVSADMTYITVAFSYHDAILQSRFLSRHGLGK